MEKGILSKCPMCGGEYTIHNPELFVERTSYSWELIKDIFVQMPLEYQEEVKKRNNIINLNKEVKEKGYVKIVCQPCQSIMSWEEQLKLKGEKVE